MTPDQIEALFTRADGTYAFARWGRPICPIVFGVQDQTLEVVKGALEAVVGMAGHHMAETDPEMGVNLMFFFFRDWDELLDVPDLGALIPDLWALVGRLKEAGATQYRGFRFDKAGAIKAAFVFLRMDGALAKMPADELALSQVAQVMLLWGDRAFAETSPLAVAGETTVLRPEIAALIRAGYDRLMPAATNDSSHALRLFARVQGG
ncbi:hypothetical protein E7681_13350 [Thalassobius vesicularis]|uniref:Uncharacterized protein n=1 Tax=Thalassobius vesicularis TaxID=1294297 RepID=A0A4S3M8B7_9RHOB|nr:hypothetical protein [Thalassobius vesicularis]THD72906.1 hypothetical protein E7681_13350 [Thalassobius vesicularis]